MGQSDVEIGTALKMAIVRAIAPTTMMTSSWSRAGMKRSDYMDITPQDPIKSTNQLITLYSGYLTREHRPVIRKLLEDAIAGGDVTTAIDRIAAMVEKRAHGAFDRDKLRLQIGNAVLTSGTRFDAWKYLRDTAQQLKEGKIGTSDLIARFSGFHASRMAAILSQPEMLDRFSTIMEQTTGAGQDARKQAYDESRYGKWNRVKAAFDRLWINIGGSDQMLRMVEGIEKLTEGGETFGKLPNIELGKWLGDKTREMFDQLRIHVDSMVNPFEGMSAKWANLGDISERVDQFGEAVARFVGRLGAAKDALLSGRFKEAYDYLTGSRGVVTQDQVSALSAALQGGARGQFRSIGEELQPLARTTEEMLRSISQSQRVEVQGEARVIVDLRGLPSGATSTQQPATIQLNTGRSMSDIGVQAGRFGRN